MSPGKLIIPVALLALTASADTDPAFQKKLQDLDAKVAKIQDMTSSFEQRKFTAVLRKPLVSSGTVRIKGSVMRWDTQKPEPTVMLIDEKQVRMYYPKAKALEVYTIGQRLGQLAASPLPKLSVIRQYFSVAPDDGKGLLDKGETGPRLPLMLTPTDASLKEHLDHVRVLIDPEAAVILKVEMTDADGDRTVISFRDIQVNTGLKERDLDLVVPEGTTVTHPLGGDKSR